jgi:hypothetical protein
MRCLSSGSTSASTSVDAELAGHRFGRRAVVAGQHHDADALLAQGRRAPPRRLLHRIGDRRSMPARGRPRRRRHRGAVRTAARSASAQRRDITASILHQPAIADCDPAALHLPVTPLPAARRSPRRPRGEPRSGAARTTAARPAGARWRSRPAARRSTSSSAAGPRPARCQPPPAGPSVSVPVLSTTSVSTFSSAPAPRRS